MEYFFWVACWMLLLVRQPSVVQTGTKKKISNDGPLHFVWRQRLLFALHNNVSPQACNHFGSKVSLNLFQSDKTIFCDLQSFPASYQGGIVFASASLPTSSSLFLQRLLCTEGLYEFEKSNKIVIIVVPFCAKYFCPLEQIMNFHSASFFDGSNGKINNSFFFTFILTQCRNKLFNYIFLENV